MVDVIHLIEKVTLKNKDKEKTLVARVDTGATKSSIDIKLAAQLMLGPITKTKIVKSASGTSVRPIVYATILIRGQEFRGQFTLADRTKMTYPVLIGRNILRKTSFLIDPKPKTVGK